MSAPRVTTAPKVVSVTESSPAALSGLRSGDEILSLNGRSPRDVIEYSLLADEPELDLVVRRRGLPEPVALSVRKQAGEPLGIEVSSAVFDRVRTCDNHCSFCFIYQLPKGMRRNLYVKDDDYRLSFLYGNFTTLTRFTEVDLGKARERREIAVEEREPVVVVLHVQVAPHALGQLVDETELAVVVASAHAVEDRGGDLEPERLTCLLDDRDLELDPAADNLQLDHRLVREQP